MSGCNQRSQCCCVSYAVINKGGVRWWGYSNYNIPFPMPSAASPVFADPRLWILGPVYMGSNVSIPALVNQAFDPALYGFPGDRNELGVQMDAELKILGVINGSSQDPSSQYRAGCNHLFDYGECNVPADGIHASYTITQDPVTRILTVNADPYTFHLWIDNALYPLKTHCGPFEFYYGPAWLALRLELYTHA